MTHIEFRRLVQKHLKDEDIGRNGRVLLSSAETIKPSSIYFLGINPGGDTQSGTHIDETIEWNLSDDRLNSSYLHDYWGKGERIRKQIVELGKELTGLDEVPFSNLSFFRTRSEKSITVEDKAKCWPIHEEILKTLSPKMILAFGRIPYEYIEWKAKKPIYYLSKIEAGQGDLVCRAFTGVIGGRSQLVAYIPHLSRYQILNHQKVADWIKSLLWKA